MNRKESPRRRFSSRHRTAIHEAGHVVMAIKRRLPFKHVSIRPDDEALGRMTHSSWHPKNLDCDDLENAKSCWRIESHVLVSMAGIVAEEVVTGKLGDGGSLDMDNACNIASRRFGNHDAVAHYLDFAMSHVKQLLSEPALQIALQALTDALLEREELTNRQARQVIKSALGVERLCL